MSKQSISVCFGNGSIKHNNRIGAFGKADNINQNKTRENIYIVQEKIEVAYENIFGEAIREYDSKQKRSDRKYNSSKEYMEKIKLNKNKQEVFKEIIIDIGTVDTLSIEEHKNATELLVEYVENFKKKYPQLYIFNAVVHLDEKKPHLHLNYIPYATEYKKGLSVQNSNTKAQEEMGFDKEFNIIKSVRQDIVNKMPQYKFNYEDKKTSTRKNLSVEEYKKYKELEQKNIELEKMVKKGDLTIEYQSKQANILKKEIKALEEQKTTLKDNSIVECMLDNPELTIRALKSSVNDFRSVEDIGKKDLNDTLIDINEYETSVPVDYRFNQYYFDYGGHSADDDYEKYFNIPALDKIYSYFANTIIVKFISEVKKYRITEEKEQKISELEDVDIKQSYQRKR